MTKFVYLTPAFAVASQLAVDDIAAVAGRGFRTLIAVRPDGEDTDSPRAGVMRLQARKAGLRFQYVPATMHDATEPEAVDRFEAALKGAEGPVLAYCKSGTRSALLWGLAAARHQPLECVREALQKAGVDPEIIEDELQEQQAASVDLTSKAGRCRSAQSPAPALLCRQAGLS